MKRRFDWLTDTKVRRPDTAWDVEIFSTHHFAVIPSLGSIVPGWLLIVPRKPVLNLAELTSDERAELLDLATLLEERLDIFGHEVFEFEHGSPYAGSPMGCGVDQAHLHVVPLPFDLCRAASEEKDASVRWSSCNDITDPWTEVCRGQEYMLVRGSKGRVMIGDVHIPTSQWMRRLIARRVGQPTHWDYKVETGLVNIIRTRELLAQ